MRTIHILFPQTFIMFWLALILFLLAGAPPVFAEHVYTNDDLKKYKGHYNVEKTGPTNEASSAGYVKIYSQGLQWTDITSGYSHYAWKVKLRNTGDTAQSVYIEFRLLNGRGYVVDMANDNVFIGAHKTDTFRGTGMIKNRLAKEVRRTEVTIQLK